MPLTKSAKKALLVADRRKKENDLVRASVKNVVKGVRLGVKNGADDMTEKLKSAYKELDMAAKKNVIHKNKAARLKSGLAKAVATNTVAATKTTKAKKKPAAKRTTTKKK